MPVRPCAARFCFEFVRGDVIEGERLPAASGGVDALSAAIERPATARGLKRSFTVKVHVGPRSLLAATVTSQARRAERHAFNFSSRAVSADRSKMGIFNA